MTVVPPNGLEHFQEKWIPVFRSDMRRGTFGHFQEKWIPVFHPDMRKEAPDRMLGNMQRSFGVLCRGHA